MGVFCEFCMELSGVGFIFCSEHAVKNIKEGEDYLSDNFEKPEQVEAQAVSGKIVGVSTGSSGTFIFRFYWGYPKKNELEKHKFKLRLGIEVSESVLYVRDLYDLMDWSSDCPKEQILRLDNGFYHITLLSNLPVSKVIGDNQVVKVFLNRLDSMPMLRYNGVPTLC